MSTHRSRLNRAAAHVAGMLGRHLRQRQPLTDDGEEGVGHVWFRWWLINEGGRPDGAITLRCSSDGGVPALFCGVVDIEIPGTARSVVLVAQEDFPGDGNRSAKETRARFVAWTEQFDGSFPSAGSHATRRGRVEA